MIPTIKWHKNSIRIIDQTKLPEKLSYVYCRNIKSLWNAIKTLQVRGAPAIGVAAAFGTYLGIKDSKQKSYANFKKHLDSVTKYLATSRPTAVNLFWALKRMESAVSNNKDKNIKELKNILFREANSIFNEDRSMCLSLGAYGARLIGKKDAVLTVCNAGALATSDYGTALAVMYKANAQHKSFNVYACETRPLLQGARLTTWELNRQKIDVTLICESMVAQLMKNKKINKIFTGADRIASNGDTANKIGTYHLAVLANRFKIPFYVVAPSSTFDLSLASGKYIPIEERKDREVTHFNNKPVIRNRIQVYNPAFDVTSHNLISAIITERGIVYPNFKKNIKKVLNK